MSLNKDLTRATHELTIVRAELDQIEQALRAGEIVPFDDYFLAVEDLNIALDRVDVLIGMVPWMLWMLWFVGYVILFWLLFVSVQEGYWFGIVIPVIGGIVLTQHVYDFLVHMRIMRNQALRRLKERNANAGPSSEGTV